LRAPMLGTSGTLIDYSFVAPWSRLVRIFLGRTT
jgi:hypothetical protein